MAIFHKIQRFLKFGRVLRNFGRKKSLITAFFFLGDTFGDIPGENEEY